MANRFFVITGTSRGIGEALARRILTEGDTVLGVARSQSDSIQSDNYHHLSFDLTEISKIDTIMEKVSGIFEKRDFDFVCLVNNASATEPVGPVEACPSNKITSHVEIGLLAPMVLTSRFIQRFKDEKIRKKVAFMSSGAAFTAMPDESVYCTSKAGLHMFAQCVGKEQENKENGFEIVSVGPGMVDTSMQKAVRAKNNEEFAMAEFFKQAYKEGRLQDPAQVAEKIYTILGNRYEQGKYVSVSDV